jgi:hypothetical protein
MKLIWNKNMYVNTVHVEDLCHVITHLIKEGVPGECLAVIRVLEESDDILQFILG